MFLSLFVLLKIVSFIFAISVAVVKGKIMAAMIIMAVEANNDSNNIKWSFAVVL